MRKVQVPKIRIPISTNSDANTVAIVIPVKNILLSGHSGEDNVFLPANGVSDTYKMVRCHKGLQID